MGGSRGIGAAIVSRLAVDGAVASFLVSPDRPGMVAGYPGREGRLAGRQRIRQVKAAVDRTLTRLGRLDILVVNAGILRLGTIDEFALEDFDRMVAVNIRGVFAALHYAAPQLSKGGRIITIGSNTAVRVGFPGSSVYAMTKAAVAGLVKGTAIDLAPRAITVNNIQPGRPTTDLTKGVAEFVLPLIPLGRMGETREVAGLVSYLAREEAGFITGASLTIDGGYSV